MLAGNPFILYLCFYCQYCYLNNKRKYMNNAAFSHTTMKVIIRLRCVDLGSTFLLYTVTSAILYATTFIWQKKRHTDK